MKCAYCGTEILNENAKFCHKCGKAFQAQDASQPFEAITKQSVNFSAPVTNVGVGAIWPEWHIEDKPLGRGSYGVVYKAVRRDHNVESYAAIKVISIPSDASEIDSLRSEGLDMNATKTYLQGIVDDFVSEIQLMESLKGIQNIVSVEDYKVVEKVGQIGWDIYIRMELLTPFNNYICDKKLTEAEVIKLGCDICTALEVCGKRNIIHRDIKPENIFINDFGYFKLGDFGIARKMENLTGGLSQKGTFNYMAPEVANSNAYDARVDTYSLGIVLYRLLNGNRLPFLDTEKQLLNPNERRMAVERRIKGEALPAPCEASPAMANIILRACAFNPNDRFATATEMRQALESVSKGAYMFAAVNVDKTTTVRKAPKANPQPIAAQPVNTFGKPSKKKNHAPIIIAIILLLAALMAIGYLAVSKIFGDKGRDDESDAPFDDSSAVVSDESGDIVIDESSEVSEDVVESQVTSSEDSKDADVSTDDSSQIATVTLTSVEIQSLPSKTVYYVGDKLNTYGLELTANYSDGSTKSITKGFTCTPTTLNKAGSQTITVTYGDKTDTFSVTVKEVTTLRSISVKTDPKKYYYVGESLDTSGMTVEAIYTNGTTKIVTGWIILDFSSETAGEKWLTVSYSEGGITKTARFFVIVYQLRLSSITIKTNPTKTSYYLGDSLNTSGMIVEATYSNGSTKTVTNWTVSGFSSISIGTKTVTVSYSEGGITKTDTFSVTVQDNISWSLSADGVLTIYGTGKMHDYSLSNEAPWYPQKDSIKKVVISSGITSIGDRSFERYSNITSVTMPNSITSIGNYTFSYCTSLTSITISGSVTSIGERAFFACGNLTSVIIPNGVTKIEYNAFGYCGNLTSLTIPNSVTIIEDIAFEGCIFLTSITYNGTMSQWYSVTKGEKWDNRTDNYTIYCTDGDIPKN